MLSVIGHFCIKNVPTSFIWSNGSDKTTYKLCSTYDLGISPLQAVTQNKFGLQIFFSAMQWEAQALSACDLRICDLKIWGSEDLRIWGSEDLRIWGSEDLWRSVKISEDLLICGSVGLWVCGSVDLWSEIWGLTIKICHLWSEVWESCKALHIALH